MRPRTLALVVTTALLATLVAAPSSAATTTAIKPGKLPRGADVAVPHLEGKTVVDGAVRVPIDAPTVRLLGKSGSAYVVAAANGSGGGGRLLRVTAAGAVTKLGRGNLYMSELSGDGESVISTKVPDGRKSVITVRSATTGSVVARRDFRGYVSVLDAETDRVLIGGERKTLVWVTSTGSVGTVSELWGYAGDLAADVFAGYTKDPYAGGCTVVARLSTGEELWRSCKERVETFNADATRMATIALLSDGIGPSYVAVRRVGGSKRGAYEVPSGWFGEIRFETPTALLLEANGARKAATVRCTDGDCERASGLSQTVQPRIG